MESGSRESIPLSGKLDDRENVWQNPKPFEELPPEVQRLIVNKRRKYSGERSTLDKLEGKHVLSMILYIDKMSPVMKTDIYSDVSRSNNMSEKLKDLSDMGIVDVYSTVKGSGNVFMITEKGRRISGLIDDIVKIIDEEE